MDVNNHYVCLPISLNLFVFKMIKKLCYVLRNYKIGR